MKGIILAAGFGMRTHRQIPKCLIELPNGKTILENQIDIMRRQKIKEIIIVVGFKKELIMEKFSSILYQYNPIYHITNTAKSLLCALDSIDKDDFVWINGDVVLEEEVLKRVLENPGNSIAVNKAKCGQEEVKYSLNNRGQITRISKDVYPGEGEALGVDKIVKENFVDFIESLRQCEKNDFDEKAIELCIEKNITFYPVDVSDCFCVEIDTPEDLEKAYLSKL